MKKSVIIVFVMLLAVMAAACSKGNEIKKKAGDFDVVIVMDKNPPVTGQNEMNIRITDSSGTPVKDARVMVNYSMTAMSGMPAMNYTSNAVPEGNGYRAKTNYSMPGSWNHEIRITRDKDNLVTFTVDVR